MANAENLKSYKPGQSGNPNGRPFGSQNVSTVLTSMLREIAPKVVIDASFIKEISKGRKKPTIAEAVAARLIYQAVINGDSKALKELLDRTEGRARQVVDIRTNEGLNNAASFLHTWLDQQRQLNTDYGVPMPTPEYLSTMVSACAEIHGVIESDLAARVKSDYENRKFSEG